MAVRAIDTLRRNQERLVIAQQCIVEFWAVATRPAQSNGLGFAIAQASIEIEDLQKSFVLLPEVPIHDVWQRLVIQYQVSGKSVHDARLVAAMIVHGVDRILTFNVADFARYVEITGLDPAQFR
jgi:predicted nucleic acid-binding protein